MTATFLEVLGPAAARARLQDEYVWRLGVVAGNADSRHADSASERAEVQERPPTSSTQAQIHKRHAHAQKRLKVKID